MGGGRVGKKCTKKVRGRHIKLIRGGAGLTTRGGLRQIKQVDICEKNIAGKDIFVSFLHSILKSTMIKRKINYF